MNLISKYFDSKQCFLIAIFGFILIFITSCTIEKRLYNSGFSIKWNTKKNENEFLKSLDVNSDSSNLSSKIPFSHSNNTDSRGEYSMSEKNVSITEKINVNKEIIKNKFKLIQSKQGTKSILNFQNKKKIMKHFPLKKSKFELEGLYDFFGVVLGFVVIIGIVLLLGLAIQLIFTKMSLLVACILGVLFLLLFFGGYILIFGPH